MWQQGRLPRQGRPPAHPRVAARARLGRVDARLAAEERKDALAQAETLALKSREVAEGFISAFRLAYSSERLDLRMQAALDLARCPLERSHP